MRYRVLFAATAAVLACCISCKKVDQPKKGGDKGNEEQETPVEDKLTHLHFIEETSDFANPERGYYYPYSFSKAGKPVSANDIKSQRKYNRTLVLLEFYLTRYTTGDIADDYLKMIGDCFNSVREAGAKAVVRFAYSDSESKKPWDVSEELTLRHIAQVKPLLQENADVILCLQAGFVGVWGEWYYTENFIQGPRTDEDYLPRKRVTEALLDALPATREVSLRTPTFKMKMYGLADKDTITRETAHNGSKLSRLGGHNDCFVANATDYGTYVNNKDRAFWNGDTRYTIMGGETCDATTKYCHCENTIESMEKYHWTYLNSDYNKQVLSVWKDEMCYDEASMRLGYRLFVSDVSYDPELAVAGKQFTLNFDIYNEGFAAPQNPRDAYIILENGSNKTVLELGSDPRFWMDGETTKVSKELTLDAAGTYKLYMYLPDPEPRLKDNPYYAIRLANKNCWNDKNGYNSLGEITVK